MTGPTETEPGPGRQRRRAQRTLFDAIAGRYDAFRPGYPPTITDFVLDTAGLGPGAAILEVGCGTGQLTQRLAGRGFRLTAIDPGASMIAAARRRVADPQVRFHSVAFEDLDAAGASFDLVISAAAFHWIDPEVRFSKSARLLRPGGWLALLGTEERYAEPLGSALEELWIRHGDTGGAWHRRPSDPQVIVATGLFGPPVTRADTRPASLAAGDILALEATRGTYLSWAPATRRAFTEDLRQLLASMPGAAVTRETDVTMARVPLA